MHAMILHWRRLTSVGVLVLVGVAASGTGFVPRAEASGSDPTGTIAFTWAPSFTVEEIGSIRPDGSMRTDLTNEEGFDAMAAYSPDGRRIAFSSTRSMPPGFQGSPLLFSELYVMDADGSNVQRITFNEGLTDVQGAWSPDGRRIVVARGPGTAPPPGGAFVAPTDLWIIDLATGRERQLTNSPATHEWYPRWSPDGRRIAFAGALVDPDNQDVYTIRVDGRSLRRLTSHPGLDWQPHYSPNGKSIAFASDRTGNSDVFVMRKNGTKTRQLTDHPSDDDLPCYSPDGKFIAFSSDRDGIPSLTSDIFRMRADGTQQTNLTRSLVVDEFDCDWQPR
jgi:Tol biopolymer transport system component